MSVVRPDDAPAAGGGAGARDQARSASAMIVALAIVTLGIYVVSEAMTGADNPGYAVIGPGVFPFIFGVALVLVGLALFFESFRGRWRVMWSEHASPSVHSRESGNPEISPLALGPRLRGDERATDSLMLNVLLVAAALILDVMLMAPLGFIVASAVLFTLVSTAFGNRRFITDTALGLAFGATIYAIFVHGLGLSLPAGSIWGSLPWMS